MNFLALRLEERTKIKMRRWWYHASDDIGPGLIAVAIFAAGVVITLGYGMWKR